MIYVVYDIVCVFTLIQNNKLYLIIRNKFHIYVLQKVSLTA